MCKYSVKMGKRNSVKFILTTVAPLSLPSAGTRREAEAVDVGTSASKLQNQEDGSYILAEIEMLRDL